MTTAGLLAFTTALATVSLLGNGILFLLWRGFFNQLKRDCDDDLGLGLAVFFTRVLQNSDVDSRELVGLRFELIETPSGGVACALDVSRKSARKLSPPEESP